MARPNQQTALNAYKLALYTNEFNNPESRLDAHYSNRAISYASGPQYDDEAIRNLKAVYAKPKAPVGEFVFGSSALSTNTRFCRRRTKYLELHFDEDLRNLMAIPLLYEESYIRKMVIGSRQSSTTTRPCGFFRNELVKAKLRNWVQFQNESFFVDTNHDFVYETTMQKLKVCFVWSYGYAVRRNGVWLLNDKFGTLLDKLAHLSLSITFLISRAPAEMLRDMESQAKYTYTVRADNVKIIGIPSFKH